MNHFKLLLLVSTFSLSSWATTNMPYELKTYAIVKPSNISSSVSIGSGLVQKVHVELGQVVKVSTSLIEILEENTLRAYRSSLVGQVVKIHVTQGAAVSPGMPLVTVMDPKGKFLEITLSPEEAKLMSVGAKVRDAKSKEDLGVLDFISSLVDPDNGGVVAHVKKFGLGNRVGEVIHVVVQVPELKCSRVIAMDKLDDSDRFKVKAIYQKKICLE